MKCFTTSRLVAATIDDLDAMKNTTTMGRLDADSFYSYQRQEAALLREIISTWVWTNKTIFATLGLDSNNGEDILRKGIVGT